ncbi:MAG: PEP/pyruvate-binding domain-containing protein [Candidatus Omnitrophota bacterium]
MIKPGPAFNPLIIRGIKIVPDDPLKFNFILDTGDTGYQSDELKSESARLIRYFLAALTTPSQDMWVNLSPYEKDRIIPQSFGETEMGRDLLAEDYTLKQLASSLMYPESELGKDFWDRVYEKARELYKTTEIPIDTFNKVWIVPDKAVIYENGDIAFITESRLKVLLEADYLALNAQNGSGASQPFYAATGAKPSANTEVATQVIREIIIPEIEKEVNNGKHFANLRQIYHSLILATWFKRNVLNTVLSKSYVDSKKTSGIQIEDKDIKNKIYDQYIEAFKTGVYNYIREEYNPATQEITPKKYFSGGFGGPQIDRAILSVEADSAELAAAAKKSIKGHIETAETELDPIIPQSPPDSAILVKDRAIHEKNVFDNSYILAQAFANYANVPLSDYYMLIRNLHHRDDSQIIREMLRLSDEYAILFNHLLQDSRKSDTVEQVRESYQTFVNGLNAFETKLAGKISEITADYPSSPGNPDLRSMIERFSAFDNFIKATIQGIFSPGDIHTEFRDIKAFFDRMVEFSIFSPDTDVKFLLDSTQIPIDDSVFPTAIRNILSFIEKPVWKSGSLEGITTITNETDPAGHSVKIKIHYDGTSALLAETIRNNPEEVTSPSSRLRSSQNMLAGLYVSKSIIEAHGGELKIEVAKETNEVDFIITLPATQSGANDGAMLSQIPAPSHWNKSWPVPTEEEIDAANKLVGSYKQDAVLELLNNIGETFPLYSQNGARLLRAVNFLYPDLASLIILSFNFHQAWSYMLFQTGLRGDVGLIEPGMMAQMIGRAIILYESKLKDSRRKFLIKKEIAVTVGDSELYSDVTWKGIIGLLGYMPEDYAFAIVDTLDKDKLRRFLELIRNTDMPGRNYEMAKKTSAIDVRIRSRLEPGKLTQPSGRYTALPVVKKSRPGGRTGRAVGTLVIIRDDEPSIETLSEISKDSVVAMNMLPVETENFGPFNGLITFREEDRTSHAAARARDWGIPHGLAPGPQSIEHLEGKQVVIDVTNNDVIVREATEEDLESLSGQPARGSEVAFPKASLGEGVFYLGADDQRMHDPKQVGYKTALLNLLATQSLAVSTPGINVEIENGSSLAFNAFEETLTKAGVIVQFRNLLQKLGAAEKENEISSVLDEVREILESREVHDALSELIEEQIPEEQLDELLENGIFVRTSSNFENLPLHPGFASGLHHTVPNVRDYTDLHDAIINDWLSLYTMASFNQRRERHIDEFDAYPSVWLVPSIREAGYSFNIHTSDAQTGQTGQAVIEVVAGLGEALVSGAADFQGLASQIIMDKETGEAVSKRPGTKKNKRVLDYSGVITASLNNDGSEDFIAQPDADNVARALTELSMQIEDFFGSPQELEGALAYDKETGEWTITLLQTRFLEPAEQSSVFVRIGLAPHEIAWQAAQTLPVSATGIETNQKTEVPGGIDLNDSNLEIETRGDGIDVKLSGNYMDLDNIQIDGFSPIIIQITPSTIHQLLGIAGE